MLCNVIKSGAKHVLQTTVFTSEQENTREFQKFVLNDFVNLGLCGKPQKKDSLPIKKFCMK